MKPKPAPDENSQNVEGIDIEKNKKKKEEILKELRQVL